MKRSALALAITLTASSAFALPVGDSICEGVAIVSGQTQAYVKRGARLSFINGNLARVPVGSKVELCAGTNDALAGLGGFEASIDKALAIIKARKLKVVWVGPVKTTQAWDGFADKADTLLALRLGSLGIRYVSPRAMGIKPSGDGVHPYMNGYLSIYKATVKSWQK